MTVVNDSLKTAISNWVWLAELPSATRALLIGEHSTHMRLGLETHFDTLDVHPKLESHNGELRYDSQAYDCVALDAGTAEQFLTGGRESADLLRDLRRVVRVGGCVFLPVEKLGRRRPRTLAGPLRRAGYSEIRPVYVYESLERPDTFIPANRRTTAFFESWAWGGLRGTARAALAITGAHHVSQPSLFFLAYP